MGTWGHENFEDDRACDYLDSIVDQLVQTIEAFFEPVNQDDFDIDRANSKVMPSVDILITLCKRYQVSPRANEAQVDTWENKLLQMYDETIDEHWPKPEYKVQRRKVIETTFTELKDVARQLYRG